MNVRELISTEQIDTAVAELGARLSADYAGRPLTILSVLSGSIMLVADLMRCITVRHQLGVLLASSYRGEATAAGTLRLNLDFLPPVKDRDVLLVDDIFDTGQTLFRLTEALQELQPASIRSAVLLWKKDRQRVSMQPDYHCFNIPDEFVVGYGLDYNGEFRHLPFIGILENC